ncbi:MAG: ABC transporter ATP-binding protein [Burkholderiales bacterium]|nr:ABC transporter ATP-binding protein [Burkholderiales bacterium]
MRGHPSTGFRLPSVSVVSPASPALVLDQVTCTFPARGRMRADYTAVRAASLRVLDGEFVSLVGPTGCGKSTLLNLAAGLQAPTEGEVRIFGTPSSGLNASAGYLFQTDALFPWRTALDNVAIGLELRGVVREQARERAREWLQRVGLAAHATKYPHEMSGGMRKRAALAQMLILEPRMLLMDEPFSALDVQTRQLMENELLGLWAQARRCVLFVTHDLEEAIALSNRVVVLSAGPASHPIAEYEVDLPRPRDVQEIAMHPRFVELHRAIWSALKQEVMKAHGHAFL